ncbi:MAG: aldo/keto reductase [Lachnospiraceae bacterium]|nr:aldo/keto reductase [Lachnospiraceae bacterium]
MIKKTYKDVQLSTLGLGNMRFHTTDSTGAHIQYDKAHEVIDLAYESGINYFDTAHVYNSGDSERCLGEAMKKYPRDSFYVATKFNINASKDYRKTFAEQLERLQTDHIDFYLVHCITDGNVDEYLASGLVDFLEEKRAEGKITYLGFSSHASTATLERFADSHNFDFAQIQLNYYDWYFGNAKNEYEALVKRNIPITVMEPVRGGRLAELTPDAEAMLKEAHPEWSISSWAMRFVKSLPGIQVVLSGMNNLEQVKDNVATFSSDDVLSAEDQKILEEACRLFKKQLTIPCTACKYCVPACPMKINIPEFLRVLNDVKANGDWGLQGKIAAIESDGQPGDCIGCGACRVQCPQSLDIPAFMQELAEKISK